MNKLTTVYDVKTGEPITLDPVDARERLQAGLATAKPVVKESLTTEMKELLTGETKEEMIEVSEIVEPPAEKPAKK